MDAPPVANQSDLESPRGMFPRFSLAGLIRFFANPLVIHDTRRLVRSRAFQAVYLFALGSGVLILCFILAGATIDSKQGQMIFSGIVTGVQVVLLFTFPAIALTSIVSERDGRTIEALALSRMSAVEVVWGKFLSVLTNGLILLASAAPLLFMTTVFGGITDGMLAIALVSLLVTSVTIAVVGVSFSARAASLTGALVRGYIVSVIAGIAIVGVTQDLIGRQATSSQTFDDLSVAPWFTHLLTPALGLAAAVAMVVVAAARRLPGLAGAVDVPVKLIWGLGTLTHAGLFLAFVAVMHNAAEHDAALHSARAVAAGLLIAAAWPLFAALDLFPAPLRRPARYDGVPSIIAPALGSNARYAVWTTTAACALLAGGAISWLIFHAIPAGDPAEAPTVSAVATPVLLAAAITLGFAIATVNAGVLASLQRMTSPARIRWMTALPALVVAGASVVDWLLTEASGASAPVLGPLSIQGLLDAAGSDKGTWKLAAAVLAWGGTAAVLWATARSALASALARNPEAASLTGTLLEDYRDVAAWPARFTRERVVDRLPPPARPPMFDIAAHAAAAARRTRERRDGA